MSERDRKLREEEEIRRECEKRQNLKLPSKDDVQKYLSEFRKHFQYHNTDIGKAIGVTGSWVSQLINAKKTPEGYLPEMANYTYRCFLEQFGSFWNYDKFQLRLKELRAREGSTLREASGNRGSQDTASPTAPAASVPAETAPAKTVASDKPAAVQAEKKDAAANVPAKAAEAEKTHEELRSFEGIDEKFLRFFGIKAQYLSPYLAKVVADASVIPFAGYVLETYGGANILSAPQGPVSAIMTKGQLLVLQQTLHDMAFTTARTLVLTAATARQDSEREIRSRVANDLKQYVIEKGDILNGQCE